ncbi:MAG: ABC transporter substrate-binding protein [Flavobacteriales bacterium]
MKKTFTDQMKRTVEIPFPPERIVSLVPSQSELLWDLGLRNQLAAITKFCIHPAEMFETVQRVGGTKKLNLPLIEKINPDLIIGNKEENTREEIEYLAKKYPVWMSDVNTYEDAIDMIGKVGEITNTYSKALGLIVEIENAFAKIKVTNSKPSVIYLIWKNPWMAVGTHSFIHHMMEKIGLKNTITQERYPEVSMDDLKEFSPEVLILSTEPFPFSQNDVLYFQTELPATKVWLVNGEMFSWYGSRMKSAATYFTQNLSRFV